VALAETLGSVAATLCVNPAETTCVGLEINANHIRSVRSGFVTGVARPLHLGNSTQVWDIRIFEDEQERLICVCRLTMAVLKR
jgi:1,4-dihydroxy-2-naphthoyl-CoA hydrolase